MKGAVIFAWVWVMCECGGAENIALPRNETPAPTSAPNPPKKLKLSLNKPRFEREDISVKETRDLLALIVLLHCSDCVIASCYTHLNGILFPV